MALFAPPGARNLTKFSETVKFGGSMLLKAAKEFQVGRINEKSLEAIVSKYTDSLADQIATLDEAQQVRHLEMLTIQNAQHKQVLNMIKIQSNRIARADDILEQAAKNNPAEFFEFLKNLVSVQAFKILMDRVMEMLKTVKGKIALSILLFSIIRVMDTLILGGLLTRGTIGTIRGTAKVNIKVMKFLLKKMVKTVSACRRVVYFVMLSLYMLTLRKKKTPSTRVVLRNNSPKTPPSKIKRTINNSPVKTKRSRKQPTPQRASESLY